MNILNKFYHYKLLIGFFFGIVTSVTFWLLIDASDKDSHHQEARAPAMETIKGAPMQTSLSLSLPGNVGGLIHRNSIVYPSTVTEDSINVTMEITELPVPEMVENIPLPKIIRGLPEAKIVKDPKTNRVVVEHLPIPQMVDNFFTPKVVEGTSFPLVVEE